MAEVESQSSSGPGDGSQKGVKVWLRNKFGRIVTVVGGCGMVLDLIPPDISPISDYLRNLVGVKVLSVIGALCFLLSFARHQQIANRVNRLEQQKQPPP